MCVFREDRLRMIEHRFTPHSHQQCVRPDRDGLGHGVDVVVVLVFWRAGERVNPAVLIRRLRVRLSRAARRHFDRRVVGQEVVVELGTVELALEGPRRGGVRFGDVVAGVAGGGRRSARAVHGRFLGETLLGEEGALHSVLATQGLDFGRAESFRRRSGS